MDCCNPNKDGSHTTTEELPNVSSPEMFDSDTEHCNEDETVADDVALVVSSPQKPSQAELVTKTDNNLLARMNKYLCGVPPPPKLTICRTDCSEFLLRIYENHHLFCTPCPLPEKQLQVDAIHKSVEKQKETMEQNNCYARTKHTSRNLSNAFDACDLQYQTSSSNDLIRKDLQGNSSNDNLGFEHSIANDTKGMLDTGKNVDNASNPNKIHEIIEENSTNQVPFKIMQEQSVLYHTIDEKKAASLAWPEAYNHKCHGIHYNRNKAIEEFESITSKLCEKYIGAETQSTCTVWFSKQAPGSARKRNLLAKRNNGQSPGKRFSHLTKRRRTFSSANLQGLALNNKKLLALNIKKPFVKKGKSPRGKSPRGKSPRGKTPKSSGKKKAVRRLVLDGMSPLKSRIETSKRALFQSPPSDRAGPSKLYSTKSNPQNIKRALFPTPKKIEDDSEGTKRTVVEESRKRKCEEELEGPRFKWAKSLSFDCSHEVHNNTITSWDQERHSSSNVVEKNKPPFSQGQNELSDTHRKKLLWAVAEALRSKGIRMTHPQFKQYASNLARTIKKLMPDLENRDIPRKPGSTSDRMLKLANHHVVFIVDARPTD